MLDSLGWRSLEDRRADARLIFFYKILYNLVAVPLPQYSNHPDRITRHMHPLHFVQILATTSYNKCSLFPLAIIQVNRLPHHILTCNHYHNISSVTNMLEDLDWPLLQDRRLRTRPITFYKIIHFQVAICPTDLFVPSDNRTRHSNPNCYKHSQISKDIYRYSFYPPTIIQWNQLPTSIVTADTVESFKGLLTVQVLIPIVN